MRPQIGPIRRFQSWGRAFISIRLLPLIATLIQLPHDTPSCSIALLAAKQSQSSFQNHKNHVNIFNLHVSQIVSWPKLGWYVSICSPCKHCDEYQVIKSPTQVSPAAISPLSATFSITSSTSNHQAKRLGLSMALQNQPTQVIGNT